MIEHHNLQLVRLGMFNVYKFQKRPIYYSISLLRINIYLLQVRSDQSYRYDIPEYKSTFRRRFQIILES